MELLKYSEDGNDDKMTYFMKIKLNGGCGLFFFFLSFLPVCVQALGTPATDRPVHLQDLTGIAMTMGEQMRNNPRKQTQQKRMETQTGKVNL